MTNLSTNKKKYSWRGESLIISLLFFSGTSIGISSLMYESGEKGASSGVIIVVLLIYAIVSSLTDREGRLVHSRILWVLGIWLAHAVLTIVLGVPLIFVAHWIGLVDDSFTPFIDRAINFIAALPLAIWAMRRSRLFVTLVGETKQNEDQIKGSPDKSGQPTKGGFRPILKTWTLDLIVLASLVTGLLFFATVRDQIERDRAFKCFFFNLDNLKIEFGHVGENGEATPAVWRQSPEQYKATIMYILTNLNAEQEAQYKKNNVSFIPDLVQDKPENQPEIATACKITFENNSVHQGPTFNSWWLDSDLFEKDYNLAKSAVVLALFWCLPLLSKFGLQMQRKNR